MIHIRRLVLSSILVGLAAATIPCLAQVTLLSENFEGLTLKNTVDEGVPGPVGDGGGTAASAVWTNVPPTGWVDNDSGVPGFANTPDNNGVFDWAGWSFANRDWWVMTAGDQDRSQFTNASGTIMVADPDEWDDAPHPGGPPSGPWYDTFIRTPAIALTGIQANTVVLEFDSSWRDEFDSNYHQTGNITVAYDGGAAVEILRWESNPVSPNFKDDAQNEHVTIGLNNPVGASSMVVTFGLFDAGNDWWWALDNLPVTGQAASNPGSLSINDVTVNEEDGSATLTVTRSGGSDGAITVNFKTFNDTAGDENGAGDYVSKSGVLAWADGDGGNRSIVIAITDDSVAESTEAFRVVLSGATGGASISDDTGVVTILDTDVVPPVDTLGTASLAILALILLMAGLVYARRMGAV